MKLLFAALLLFSPVLGHASLKPFTSDGCSSSPDGMTKNKEFLQCCIAHDFKYWAGGTEQEKDEADAQFYACMKRVARPSIASIYFRSVRIGSSPRTNLPWAWGYGWSPSRDMRPLSEAEQKEVQAKKPAAALTIPLIKSYPHSLPKMAAFDLAMKYVFQDNLGSVGEVYALAEWKDNRVQSVVEVKDFYLVTSQQCPHGYYLFNQATYETLKSVDLKNFGGCPEIK